MTRRAALQLAASAMLVPAAPALAQQRGPLQVDVDQATLKPRPIAIPEFLGEDQRLSAGIANVIAANLERSGLFEPLDPRGFIERISDLNTVPRFADWRSSGAEALLMGRATAVADGRVRADFRLWDVVLGKQIASGYFATSPQSWRRIGHIIADQVWEKLTLEKGFFDTRIVFVDETGPKDKRVKRLAIMDQDGFNVRLLSQGQELVLTPRFSPTSQEITYMSYARDQPRVVLMRLDTGQREVVGDFPGMTFAPRFSPDGQRVIMSLQQGGDSSIMEMDMRSRQMRQLTQGGGLDTGPCYAPDGRQIVFEFRPQWEPATLRHGRRWRRAPTHQLWRGSLLHSGVVTARRLCCIYETALRKIPDRHHAPRWCGRAGADRGFPQRRPHLGAEWPVPHVFPRSVRP